MAEHTRPDDDDKEQTYQSLYFVKDRHKYLKKFEFFSFLSDKELAGVLRVSQLQTFPAQMKIPQRGRGSGLSILISGRLREYRQNTSGREQIFRILEKGDSFGYSGLVGDEAFPTEYFSMEASELLVIPFARIHHLIRSNIKLSLFLFKALNCYAEKMKKLADSLSLDDAYTRLISWLCEWVLPQTSKHQLKNSDVTLRLPLTQVEIAAHIGTVREVVSRGFSQLEKEGILALSGRQLTFLTPSAIEELMSKRTS